MTPRDEEARVEHAPRLMEPDWARLGARFGEPDTCVSFHSLARVYRAIPGRAPRLIAEDVVALREDREGVRVQVACGLILALPGARLVEVDRVTPAAHVTV